MLAFLHSQATNGGTGAAFPTRPLAAMRPAEGKDDGKNGIAEGQAVEVADPEPAMSKEDKAAAARERFLARKRKAPA